jgi:hypothetical protein
MLPSDAKQLHAAAVKDLTQRRAELEALQDRQGAAALAIQEGERKLACVIDEAAGAMSRKTPLSSKLIEAYSRERASLDLATQARARLEFQAAAAEVVVAEAAAVEAEEAVIVAGEELRAHLEAQGKAAQALAELEGGDVSLQVDGPASKQLKERLATARDRADGARRTAEAKALAFEVRRLPAVLGGRR